MVTCQNAPIAGLLFPPNFAEHLRYPICRRYCFAVLLYCCIGKMADETPPRRTTRSQTNGTPSETANGRPVRDRRQAAILNIGTLGGPPGPARRRLPPTPSRAAVAAGAAAPLPDTPAAAARTREIAAPSPRRPGPPLGQPHNRPEDMPKAFAHLLIDPEVAGMGFKKAIRHADGRHAAAGGAPEEYHALRDRRKRYLRNPRALEIAEEIVRGDLRQRLAELAREGGNLDALTAAQRHSLDIIREEEQEFEEEALAAIREREAMLGAEAGAGAGAAAGAFAGAGVGAGGQPGAVAEPTATVGAAAAGGDALINGLVESVARLTAELAVARLTTELAEARSELAEARARVEVLEGQQQQPAEARRSDQQQE